MRGLIASIRGLKPGMSNTLKSDGVNPVKDMLGPLLLLRLVREIGVEREDGAPDAPEVEAGQVGRGQAWRVDLDDLLGDGLECRAVVDGGLHDQDLLLERV